ncbi:MAG: phosphoserine phosphatase SerB [Phenylobacterium sp.]
MQLALTLVSPQAGAPDAALSQVIAALSGASARVKEPRPLGPGALDVLIEAADLPAVRAAALEAVAGLPVDACVQPLEGRRKRLFVADMDSTIIGCECIDEIADFAGKKAEIAAITERAMRGELEFEAALRERVGMLKGLPTSVLQQAYDERVRLNPGARTLVRTMAANGTRCVLVSGGFTFFTSRVAQAAGFHANRANTLGEGAGLLTGAVGEPILGRQAKLDALTEEAAALPVPLSETLAIGDGANDLAMIKAAGLGIAYRAKPIVAAEADAKLDHADLTAVLYFQGYRAEQFVTD